ncbi:MAG: ParB/RepB/Spo0J family partition protein [Bacteroidales bacterium]|nr:ParB/RepB/Spo0J family partition protein [Bacteroidales bacterium]
MKSSAKNAGLTAYKDLFKDDMTREADSAERVMELPLGELFTPQDHPFRVVEDDAMREMADSIVKFGVLTPGIARPRPEGGYELLSGNRRKLASILAGKDTMPVVVRDMDDDAAIILMVDANMQRETLLPSEKAKAYKMKLDALRRKAGRPSKENGVQLEPHFSTGKSRDIVAEQFGESTAQIQRFVRLTNLTQPLLQMVDDKRIPLNPAVELSYLSGKEQGQLIEIMGRDEIVPSLSQAQRLKQFSQRGKLNAESFEAIMTEEKPIADKVVIRRKDFAKYVPKSYTPRQVEEHILKALDFYDRKLKRDREAAR